jgi:hypothetical protein
VERYLESTVVTVLSRMLLNGELTSGSFVHIEATEGDDDSYDDASYPFRKKARLHYRVEETPSDMETKDALEANS